MLFNGGKWNIQAQPSSFHGTKLTITFTVDKLA